MAVAAPIVGVVRVGLVARTMFPVPVTAFESVTPPYVKADDRVKAPENVTAPPIVPENVGEADRTMLPVPVTALERVTPP